MATENVNESAKETRERLQAAEVKAWIEVDNKQTAAQAQITALVGQGAAGDPSIEAGRQAAIGENQEVVTDAKTKKAAIEYAWVHELKCKLRQLFADIDKAVAKERTERLVEATNRPEGEATREQIQDLKAETLIHSAQALIENSLHPQDLVSGSDQRTAAQLVRPDLAAELPSALAQAELAAYADKIQPIYDRQKLYYEAARDMEKGVVIGKAGETIKEAISNPSRLGHGVAALIGMGLLYHVFKDKSPDAGLKKWVMGILGFGALAVGGYGAVKGLDVLNTATGIRTDALLSSAEMKTVRAELEAKMGKDGAVVDDMMRVFDSPIENYSDAYTSALRSHSDGMEKARLLGDNGLSTDEAKFANNKFLKEGGDWLFMECYEMALKEGKVNALTDADAKRFAGAQYARAEFAGLKVGSILIALDMVKAGVGVTSSVRESRPGNPHLRELESKVSAFADVLEPTDKPDIYLIYGYPVRYNYTDSGDHVFTDLVGTTPFDKVDQSLTGDGLQSTLLSIMADAKTEALKLYVGSGTTVTGASTAELKYNDKGGWIIDPPRPRATHAGLANYLTGPNDPKPPVLLYFDTADNKVKIGMDKDGNGVPEKRVVPYTTILDVAEEFEKEVILHDRIAADTTRTLLMPFKVESYTDVGSPTPTDTEINISYGNGAKGKMTYKANVLDSYTLNAPIDADLTAKWTKSATDVCKREVLGDQRVQDALLRATTAYTGANLSLMSGLVSKFIGLAKDGVDWFMNDSIQNEFEHDWEKQVVAKMTDMLYDPVNGLTAKYVRDVYKTFPSDANFQGVEGAFINAQVTNISTGVVMATVTPEVLPDSTMTPEQVDEMVHTTGKGKIETALAALKHEDPATMSSRFQAALQTASNLVTGSGSAVRTEWYNKKVAEYEQQLVNAINTYRVIPAGPVPPGTPALTATQPTRRQVEAEIARVQNDAQRYAASYWGMPDKAAEKKLMMTSGLEGAPHYAEWKDATGLVVDYMANNLKWENYGFMPNPENLALIMDQWHKHIGMAANPPKNAADAMTAAKNFIWEVWVRMGGHKDLSPDRLYNDTIESVSDSQFRANIAQLGTLPPYDPLIALNNRPPVPGMESDLNKYKPVIQEQMETWFAGQNDIKVWSRLRRWGPDMSQWKTVYEESFAKRMNNIMTSAANPTQLYNDMEDFKLFVSFEQRTIYDALIDAGAVPETDHLGLAMSWPLFVETELIKDFEKVYFNPAPPRARDLNGYKGYVIKNVARALDVHWHTPNVPGVPFVT